MPQRLGPLAVLLCAPEGNDARGTRVVAQVADAFRRDRPGVSVEAVTVGADNGASDQSRHLAGLGFRVVAIPLLLTGGHAVEDEVFRSAGGSKRITVTPPLGPHPSLTSLLWRRVQQTGAQAHEAVVVASGIARPRVADDLGVVADWLADHWPGSVSVGLADGEDGLPGAVSRARETSGRVIVAGYLLGYGQGRALLDQAGADRVTEPLGAAPLVVSRVLDLFDAEVAWLRAGLVSDVA